MKKLSKIYVNFNLYLDREGILRRNIDFGFIFRQSFWDGFSDLTQNEEFKFDWFNNSYILNKNLSLKDVPLVYENDENLKKYYSIYDVEKTDDIEDILNFLENPKGILTVRPIFYIKGNRAKSMNFLLFPMEGSLFECQLTVRGEDFDSLMDQLSKKEKVEQFMWEKKDRKGLHSKGGSCMDCVFNLNDSAQVKKLFDSEFWSKFARKSLSNWLKK